jgi:UDP-galactopyranose mutase
MLQLSDLVCFSHLRWDFVFQRPQHLMTRFAHERRVFYVEEPIIEPGPPRLGVDCRMAGLHVVVPHLPPGLTRELRQSFERELLDSLFRSQSITNYVLWYYTPMALDATRHLTGSRVVVYDCMDELSLFRDAPAELVVKERELFARADLVFTGGQSLYEAKRRQHRSVYPFPSSVDVSHFASARRLQPDPADQSCIKRPRLGFYGVIDERLDLGLLSALADARPDWQIVLLGPVAKIDTTEIPRRPNLHLLGSKPYADLPPYIAGWDVALLPFARNAATQFISPTKTPEYLAAGRPVVSTDICDVVRPYGELGLVRIAQTPREFAAAVEAALSEDGVERIERADRFLAGTSWDRTWSDMRSLIEQVASVDTRRKRTRLVAVA